MKLIVIAWSCVILGSVEEANQDELKIQEKRDCSLIDLIMSGLRKDVTCRM